MSEMWRNKRGNSKLKTKEYTILKYICERCNTEYDDFTDIKICEICHKDMCENENCELAECAVTDCKTKNICYNCSKIEKVSGEIVCNNCFTENEFEEMVFDQN